MNALTTSVQREDASQSLARVILTGDLSKLTEQERVTHYNATCESQGLNPFTRPFEYLHLNGKLILYARKDCTDQLRSLRRVSIQVVGKEVDAGLIIVTARATMPDGRCDEDYGAVPLPANGEARANAMLKAITKAKRRVTLSICGLGFLDESEIEGIPEAQMRTVPNTAPPPAPPKTLTEQVAQAKTTLPIVSPKTTKEVQVPASRYLDAIGRALAQLEDAGALNRWCEMMVPCIAQVRAHDDALAHSAEMAAEGRALQLAGPPDDEPEVEPGAVEPEEVT
jgi:hypothetical protein